MTLIALSLANVTNFSGGDFCGCCVLLRLLRLLLLLRLLRAPAAAAAASEAAAPVAAAAPAAAASEAAASEAAAPVAANVSGDSLEGVGLVMGDIEAASQVIARHFALIRRAKRHRPFARVLDPIFQYALRHNVLSQCIFFKDYSKEQS
jgi:hypothetical protein